MLITITSSRPNEDERHQIDSFLETVMPRIADFPGVLAAYHFWRAEEGESVSFLVWESEDAMKAFRESDVAREIGEFEAKIGVAARREAYPVHYPPE
jgi:heme-degrading monooxygenase HmoA